MDTEASATDIRPATASDLDGVVDTLTMAFKDDPVWSWAFPDPADLGVWWRFLIGSALRYPEVWIASDYAAASVWIPPEGTELTEAEEDRVDSLLEDLVGPRAASVVALLERFDASHPRDRAHYYLSLLGVHPDHRGKGLGMSVLAENLRRLDRVGAAAYLESSNPANDHRYERLGFRRVGAFTTPEGRNVVATMWRDAVSPI